MSGATDLRRTFPPDGDQGHALDRFWFYDQSLYRQRHGHVFPDLLWRHGQWQFVVTSEEELRRMREISLAEAERLMAEIG